MTISLLNRTLMTLMKLIDAEFYGLQAEQ